MTAKQQSLDTSSIDFETALETIREDVNTRSEINSRIHDLLAVADERALATDPWGHPKVTQSLFRYRHDPDGVRGEFRRALETYDLDGKPEDIVEVICAAACQLEGEPSVASSR